MFLGKENKVAKIKCNNQSKRGWLRNYVYKKLILTFQYTIHNSIYEKLILELQVSSHYYQVRILKVILEVGKLGKISFWKKNFLSLKMFFALITKENSSRDVGVTYSQNMPIWNKLVSQENWFCREIGFAGKLVLPGNWFCRETGFTGKLVSCYPS